jgi:hypothetical protein
VRGASLARAAAAPAPPGLRPTSSSRRNVKAIACAAYRRQDFDPHDVAWLHDLARSFTNVLPSPRHVPSHPDEPRPTKAPKAATLVTTPSESCRARDRSGLHPFLNTPP